MKIQKILVLILIAIILLFVGWKLINNGSDGQQKEEVSETNKIVDDPIDATMELYTPWLTALQSTTTEYSKTDILKDAPMTSELRARLNSQISEPQEKDPILCLLEVPERIGVKPIYKNETEAQVVVVARGNKVPEQALVTLQLVNKGWILSNIECSNGEVAPEREFSFENEGFLLRSSLKPPLDSGKWHLIYTRDDVPGYAVPLLFDGSSTCVAADGSESVCTPESLSEASKVLLKADMQEAGALVKRLEIE